MALIEVMAAPLRRRVLDHLRAQILTGALKPGAQLVERELCESTGVSRTSIREALRQLESEYLIEARPNKGTFVTALTPEDARQIYDLRGVLEALAAQLFVSNASEAQRRKLRRAFEELDAAAAAGNSEKLFAAGTKYYDAMLDGAGNTVLRQTLRGLTARVTTLRRVTLGQADRIPATRAEMAAIQQAIEAGDGGAAFAASVAHVREAQAVLVRTLSARADDQAAAV